MNRSYIRHAVKKDFKGEDVEEVLAILSSYSEEPRPDFTYYAILTLAKGDKTAVRRLVERAQLDAAEIREEAECAGMFDVLLRQHTEQQDAHPWLKPFIAFIRRLGATEVRHSYKSNTSHWACCFLPPNLAVYATEPLVALEPMPDESGVKVVVQAGANQSERIVPFDEPVESIAATMKEVLG